MSSSSSLDCLELCRLCLEKERVSVPIFENEGDVRQIFLKITACLPVKVSRDDKLPKKICDDCLYKVELFYQFWNTTANAEKQLLQWLGEVGGLEDGVPEVLVSNVMKQEQASDSRLEGRVVQVGGQNSVDMGMIENMTIITMPVDGEQQFASVPMDTSGTVTVQAVASSSASANDQSQTSVSHLADEVEDDDDDDDDDGCDNEGMPVKEENEEDQSDRVLDQSSFVTIPCDEAGPSGLQQKIADISNMSLQPTEVNDPKTGYLVVQNGSEEDPLMFSPHHQLDHLQQQEHPLDLETKPNGLVRHQHSILQCSLCNETFVDESSFEVHYRTHTEMDHDEQQQVVVFACGICSRTFEGEDDLREHEALEHSQRDLETHLYACENCGYTSPYREELNLHQCKEDILDGNISNNDIEDDDKPFQCGVCQATFRYRQGLRLHSKLHQPDYVAPQKKHRCEICDKRFCRRQVLLVHMRTHSKGGLPPMEFVCHICGKSVSSKTYLQVHVRKHTGEKPHVCDVCNKGFISQNYLSVHRRTHTGERPHKCTHCEKSFTQRTTLVVHLRSHTGDRPYPCETCKKSFASKTMLNSHMRTHAKHTARQQLEHETQIHLQQRNLLLSPEQEEAVLRQHQQELDEVDELEPNPTSGIVLIPT